MRLDCEAKGQPEPEITWLKDGKPLELHDAPRLW